MLCINHIKTLTVHHGDPRLANLIEMPNSDRLVWIDFSHASMSPDRDSNLIRDDLRILVRSAMSLGAGADFPKALHDSIERCVREETSTAYVDLSLLLL
jgi:hypothetical protein